MYHLRVLHLSTLFADRFSPFAAPKAVTMRVVASQGGFYDVGFQLTVDHQPTAQDLENVYVATQNLDRSWDHNQRSTSVGDVVVITNAETGAHATHRVGAFGFEEFDPGDFGFRNTANSTAKADFERYRAVHPRTA